MVQNGPAGKIAQRLRHFQRNEPLVLQGFIYRIKEALGTWLKASFLLPAKIHHLTQVATAAVTISQSARPHKVQTKGWGGIMQKTLNDEVGMRHKVKPGITGWAQINGWPGQTDTVEKITQRVTHDLEYKYRWSPGLDSYILMQTPLVLLTGENAY
jgi:hypothetical protein